MTVPNRLDLDEFFLNVSDETYCIIKINENFPNYYEGNDIDIFCYNIGTLAKKILFVGNKYIEKGFIVNVVSNESNDHLYIDFYYEKKLDFRFDLYQKLPHYKNILIKPGLLSSIVENSIAKIRQYKDKYYNIYVPSKTDDLLLRYIEYVEWYQVRPDKIQHLDYILGQENISEERIRLLDKMHYYTEIPKNYNINPNRHSSNELYIVTIFRRLKGKSLFDVLKFFKRMLDSFSDKRS